MPRTATHTSVDQIQSPTLQIDWKEYWKSFQELHGGNPVEFEGRLLFADGWMYSKTDYVGPEFKPDRNDPLRFRHLRVSYWRTRLKIVTTQHTALKDLTKTIVSLNRVRNAPLKHWITLTDKNEKGKDIKVTRLLELSEESYTARLQWLADDIADCNTKIAEIEKEDLNYVPKL